VDTNKLLDERLKTHGDFTDHAQVTQSLKFGMQHSPNWDQLTPIQREALEMIQHKIGRILSGDPNHQDHWDDIVGYAKLVSDRLVPATVTQVTTKLDEAIRRGVIQVGPSNKDDIDKPLKEAIDNSLSTYHALSGKK
jgi:hypothetical protein